MMGDHVAHALQSCKRHGFMQPALACQFAKLVKIACGYPNTHAAASRLDLSQLIGWLRTAGATRQLLDTATDAHTARELAITSGYAPLLMRTVCRQALAAVHHHAPDLTPELLISRYDAAPPLSCRCLIG